MIFKRQLLFTKQVSIFSIIVIAKKMLRELIYFMHPFFINDSTLIPPKAMGTFAMITQICFLDFIEQIQLRCTRKTYLKDCHPLTKKEYEVNPIYWSYLACLF